jgi:hypothetical protein
MLMWTALTKYGTVITIQKYVIVYWQMNNCLSVRHVGVKKRFSVVTGVKIEQMNCPARDVLKTKNGYTVKKHD